MIQLEQQQHGEFVGGGVVGGVWLTPTTYIQLAGAGSKTCNIFQPVLISSANVDIVALLEYFRALRCSNRDIFRALKCSNGCVFRALKCCNCDHLRSFGHCISGCLSFFSLKSKTFFSVFMYYFCLICQTCDNEGKSISKLIF